MQRKVLTTAVALLAIAATGCSSSGSSKSGEPTVLTITAHDNPDGTFEFTFDEEALTGGVVQLVLENDGEAPHDFQLVGAAEGHTVEELAETVAAEEAPFEDWLDPAGGVGMTAPGESGSAFVNLEAGEYWYVCTQSSEVDGEEAPHGQNGMAGEVTLEGDGGGELPEASATVTATEYDFEVDGLVAGSNTVEFVNDGEMSHHVIFAPIAEGGTIEDVQEFFASQGEPSGPPPVSFETAFGTAVLRGGSSLVLDLEFEAGTTYMLACFLPDPGTAGPPHVAKGMLVGTDIAA